MNAYKNNYRKGVKTQRKRKGIFDINFLRVPFVPRRRYGSGFTSRCLAGALVALVVLATPPVSGADAPPPLRPFPAQGTVQYAFTPDDDAAGLIIGAIDRAHRRILVQAYSFTHRGIARALIRAHRRGVDVQVIADAEQAHSISTHALEMLIDGGVPVMLDANHAAAHNKIMITDPDVSSCAVITGSYNFTYAAEYRNAENVIVLRADPPLCAAYRDNWERHRAHAKRYRPSR